MNDKIQAIKNVFGDCKHLETSKCLNKSSFVINNSSTFFIYDNRNDTNQPIQIVAENDSHQLSVINNNNHEICIIKTDKCLFTDEHKKCDCIIFDAKKLFFIEISEAKNRNAKRHDAVKQLSTTIELFKESKCINLEQFDKRAIICFKNGITRPTQPSFNSNRALFKEQYQVSLEEGNHISF